MSDLQGKYGGAWMERCPDCMAEPGCACVGADGAVQDWPHVGRVECGNQSAAVDAELRGERTCAASDALIRDVADRRLF